MLQPGLRLGDRYRLDTRIGAGGMGEVWQAVDEVLDRVVAVKAMLPEVAHEPDFARRFLAEAKAMASVSHPAVASIHDYGSSRAITFLVMEFIDGESLSQALGRLGRLTPADTMHLIAQAADGLQAVHDRGIVHRDIKPANLLIRRNGALLITDFGISRSEEGTRLTVSGAVLGTPTYISPEQVLGQPATPLSDVYSLGLSAYECLAGHRPFSGDNPYAVALQRLQTAPRALSGDIPPAVVAVVEHALATDPAHRWPSAAAMADAARAAADSLRGYGGHHPPPPAARPGPPRAGQPSSGQPSSGQPSSGSSGAGPSGAGLSGAEQPWAAHSGSGPSGAAQSGAVHPGSGQFGTGQPGAVHPGSGSFGAAQPGAVHPGSGSFGAAQPGAVQPGTRPSGEVRSGASQSGSGQFGSGQFGAGRPGTVHSGAARSGAGQPGALHPGSGQFGVGQPGALHSGVGQASVGQAGALQSGAGQAGAGQAGAARARRRRLSMVAGLLVVGLAAGVTVWWTTRDTEEGNRSVAGPGATSGATGSSGTSADPAIQQAGLAACGEAFCPIKPLCWSGLNVSAGHAQPPGKRDCAEGHIWETFSAIYLPADAIDVRQEELINRADIGAACSASVMAARSRDPKKTKSWARDPWPVQVTGSNTWIVLCMASPKADDQYGSVFLPA